MSKVNANESYQLWLIHGTQPVSAGVMPGGGTGGAATPYQPLVTSFAI